ncbi:MAG: hypothetical protein HRU19_29150 [Pseudobacteriovorax sp.]|nr:hypothetical protein [Pseudobacteriovorax sp.]
MNYSKKVTFTFILASLMLTQTSFARTTSGTQKGVIESINCQNGDTQQASQPNRYHCVITFSGVANTPCPNKNNRLFNLVFNDDEQANPKALLSVALLAQASKRPSYIYYYTDECNSSPSQYLRVSGIQIGDQ